MRAVRVVVVIGCCAVFGCGESGPTLSPVSGQVHFPDGQPVVGAVVEFAALDGTGARGKTGPDGRFTLETGGVPGCSPGPCRIAIVQMLVAEGAGAHVKPHHTAFNVHPKYAKFATSGLTREVKPSPNEFAIEITPAVETRGWGAGR